jgi:hypothetical protein
MFTLNFPLTAGDTVTLNVHTQKTGQATVTQGAGLLSGSNETTAPRALASAVPNAMRETECGDGVRVSVDSPTSGGTRGQGKRG